MFINDSYIHATQQKVYIMNKNHEVHIWMHACKSTIYQITKTVKEEN